MTKIELFEKVKHLQDSLKTTLTKLPAESSVMSLVLFIYHSVNG